MKLLGVVLYYKSSANGKFFSEEINKLRVSLHAHIFSVRIFGPSLFFVLLWMQSSKE